MNMKVIITIEVEEEPDGMGNLCTLNVSPTNEGCVLKRKEK